MGLKIVLNVLLNLGLFTLGMCVYWSFKHDYFTLMFAAAFALGLLIFFKIRLLKSVREIQKGSPKS